MRYTISLCLFFNLLWCACHPAPADNPDRLTNTLASLLNHTQGLPGTNFHSSARLTQIRQSNPTNISWFTAIWDWRQVDFDAYAGGVVEAIFQQMKRHEKELHKNGFRLMAADFYAQPDLAIAGQPVGWYRRYVIKYDHLEQSGVHQDPIGRAARLIIGKRVYTTNQQVPGILFATYTYTAEQGTLKIELAYSAFPDKLEEFEKYDYRERLVTE